MTRCSSVCDKEYFGVRLLAVVMCSCLLIVCLICLCTICPFSTLILLVGSFDL